MLNIIEGKSNGITSPFKKNLIILKKLNKESSTEVTTRLKYAITSVNGLTESKDIREFVDKYLLASDARALRKQITKVSPDIDLVFYAEGVSGGVPLPIGVGFFWPDL